MYIKKNKYNKNTTLQLLEINCKTPEKPTKSSVLSKIKAIIRIYLEVKQIKIYKLIIILNLIKVQLSSSPSSNLFIVFSSIILKTACIEKNRNFLLKYL